MSQQYDLSKFDKVMADVETIKEQGNFIPACDTKEGYEASKRFVLDVTAPARKALTEAHKTTKAPFLDACRYLDQKKKELMPILEQIEAPHKEAYKAVDAAKKAEKERFENELAAKVNSIVELRSLPFNAGSEFITNRIHECGEIDTSHGFYHRASDAENARQESLEALEYALSEALKREAEALEQQERAAAQKQEQARLDAEREALQREREDLEALRKSASSNVSQINTDSTKMASAAEIDIRQFLIDNLNLDASDAVVVAAALASNQVPHVSLMEKAA